MGRTLDQNCLDSDLDSCIGAACVDGNCTYFSVDCIPVHVCCGNGVCSPSGATESCLADSDCAEVSKDPCRRFRCAGGGCVPFRVSSARPFLHAIPAMLRWRGLPVCRWPRRWGVLLPAGSGNHEERCARTFAQRMAGGAWWKGRLTTIDENG